MQDLSYNQNQYRYEIKYEIDRYQLEIIKSKLSSFMTLDPHVDNLGTYEVRSLYFDDLKNHCYYENEDGTNPREKFRIRIYNGSVKHISLECKRKENGKTLKQTCALSVSQTENLLCGGRLMWNSEMHPLLKKLYLLQETGEMHPKVIVEYDRIPYFCADGNVRITLDTDIRTTTQIDEFLDPITKCRPVMPIDKHLMEVKFDNFLPDYIYNMAALKGLRQTTFSKYYLCRKFGGLV